MCYCDEGTEKAKSTGRWLSRGKYVGLELRQIRALLRLRYETSSLLSEVVNAILPGKSSKLQVIRTVLQTNTGGWDENSKALERTRVKELGKMDP